MKCSSIRRALAGPTSLLIVSAMVLLSARAQAPDLSKVEIKTNKVADNFYTLDGQGGTIGVLAGPQGILGVDTQFAPLSDKIVAAIKQLSPNPIRFVINTHVHGDHRRQRDRNAVAAHRDMILELRNEVANLMQQGKNSDAVVAAHPTAAFDAKVVPVAPNGNRNADRFVGQLYTELSQSK